MTSYTGNADRLQALQDEISVSLIELEGLRAENSRLRKDVERLEMVLSGTGAGCWDWYIQTGEVVMNEQWANLIGYTLEEISPTSLETFQRYCHPDDLRQTFLNIQEHLEGKRDRYEAVLRMRHKDGHWIWMLDIGRVTERDPEGRPVRMTGSHVDITERKRVEQENQDKSNELEALYNGLTDIVLITDIKTKTIMGSNAIAQELLGWSADELMGLTIEALHPQDMRKETLKGFSQVARGLENSGETELLGRKGNRIPVSIKSSRIVYKGSPCLMGVMRDISENKMQEKQMQENLQLKNDFISTISHELRTPMFSILGFSSLLLKDHATLDTENRQEFLHIVHDESRRLSGLIENMLTISRIDSGNGKYQPIVFDPAPLISEVITTLRRTAEEKGLQLKEELSPAPMPVCFDKDAFKQVLLNLIDNAIKYTPAGGSVDVRLCLQEGKVVIEVADDGNGIPAEDLEKIFEKFYRSKHSANYGQGAGLGLAIVKEIMELHGGSISVSSTLHEGSRFRMNMPVIS